MAAQLLGTTGNWGIPNDQTGILITDLSFDFSNQEKQVLDKGGEIIGLSLYQEKVEIKLSGLVAKTSAFSGKLGTALVLANAIPAHLTPTGGTTIITQISFVGKLAGFVSAFNVIQFVDPAVGVIVFAAASILKDTVNRIGDLMDDGQPNASFKG